MYFGCKYGLHFGGFFSTFFTRGLQNLIFMDDRLTRIAIVSSDKCKPKKCKQECKKTCPVNRMGILFLFNGNLMALIDR
jgi:hypothetical protein